MISVSEVNSHCGDRRIVTKLYRKVLKEGMYLICDCQCTKVQGRKCRAWYMPPQGLHSWGTVATEWLDLPVILRGFPGLVAYGLKPKIFMIKTEKAGHPRSSFCHLTKLLTVIFQ